MKISCIIPVLNRRQLVIKAVSSVLNQSGGFSVEIVVVDDGSSDGTPESIRSTFPDVVLVETEGGLGPGRARNTGVRESSGNTLMFLDSDDTWLPNHVRSLVSLLACGAQVAYGITCTVNTLSDNEFFIPDEEEYCRGMCHDNILNWCFLVPSAVAVTRGAFEAVKGFPEYGFGEDWHFFLRLAGRFEFYFVPEVITQRLLHQGSLCASGDIRARVCAMLETLCLAADRESDSTAAARFRTLLLHASRKGEKWTTIQDWYMSLRRHGLV